jgi:hypothetical protein
MEEGVCRRFSRCGIFPIGLFQIIEKGKKDFAKARGDTCTREVL